jgi:hypothetical protein
MTYSPTVPQSSNIPDLIQPQIQTNFAQYASIFSNTIGGVVYNHMPMNDPNQGKHGCVIFQQQASEQANPNGFSQLFSLSNTNQLGTNPQLFVKIPKFLPTTLDNTMIGNLRMQISYDQVNTTGPQYQSFLIGGYVIFFGQTSFSGNSTTITLSPATSTLYSVIAIPTTLIVTAGFFVSASITTNNSFTIYKNNVFGPVTYNWMAIGAQ